MAKGGDVLEMLIPSGGWIITDSKYDSIQWIGCNPITEAEFNAGFSQYDTWKAAQDVQFEKDRASGEAKLLAVGLTKDEIKAIRKEK